MSQTEAIITKPKVRVYQIDFFRFLSALAVVLYHYLFRGYMADHMSNLYFYEIGPYFKYGYLGVDMFFLISGFVIALSIKSRNLKDFCISRIVRLYPSYWLSVLLTSIVIFLYGASRYTVDLSQVLLNLTMFQNYVNIPSVDGAYWSLFIEMKFYVFVIGAYLFLNKIKEIDLNYVIYLWLSLTLLYVFGGHLSIFKSLNKFLILDWSSYFIAGMIMYQIYQSQLNMRYLVLLCLSLSISIFHAVSRLDTMEAVYSTTFSPVYVSGFIVLFYTLMLLVSCGRLQIINSPRLLVVGLLTYPLYLLHQNIGFIIFNNWGSESNKYLILIITTSMMLFLSYVISHFYEPRVSAFLSTRLKQLATSLARTPLYPKNKTGI